MEPNPPTSTKWRSIVLLSLKYWDDGKTILVGDEQTKHAAASQNIFRAVVKRAKSMGMKVNMGKMQLIVVSDALSLNPEACI